MEIDAKSESSYVLQINDEMGQRTAQMNLADLKQILGFNSMDNSDGLIRYVMDSHVTYKTGETLQLLFETLFMLPTM